MLRGGSQQGADDFVTDGSVLFAGRTAPESRRYSRQLRRACSKSSNRRPAWPSASVAMRCG